MDTSLTLEDKKTDSQTEQQFLNFLNENRIKDGRATHTGVGKNAGKFDIEGPILTKQLFTHISRMMQDKIDFHLIETHSFLCPFLIDIDMRLSLDKKTRIFGYAFIKKVVEVYTKQILEYFDLNEHQKNELVRAFVFERPAPVVTDKLIKDGLHIMFPFIVSEKAVQNIIRENAIRELTETFKTMPFENNISNAIDKSVIDTNGWYMYGSTKPNIPRYELKHVFDVNIGKIDLKLYPENQLPSILSIRNKTEATPIKDSKLEEVNNYELKTSIKTSKQRTKREYSSIDKDELKEIIELVDIVNPSRADDYTSWINMGFALHSRDPDNDDLMEIWDEWSKKSAKYQKNECAKEWCKMKVVQDGLSIGSIHHWAMTDSPDKYAEFRKNMSRTYIENSEGLNVDLAKVIKKMYKYNFVCASLKNKKWYSFQKHHWVEDEMGVSLRNKICNELVYEYTKLMDYYTEKMQELEQLAEGENDKSKKKHDLTHKVKIMEKKLEKLNGIRKNLQTTSFIDNVMKECGSQFYDPEFINKLDENHYLFSFKNGILDLKTGEFRNGRPDDYISLTCGVNYVPFSEDLPYLEDIRDFLRKVQPQEDCRMFLLTLLSSLLEGHNADESFHFWTGTGGNGKSKLNELLVNSLGKYSIKFPITLFTAKRGASNSVSPEVVESKGKRYAYLEEPDEGERINVGLMKEYSGGDKIKGRGLWSNFQEFKPQFKIILFCNDMPKLPPEDNGTWRRVKALEFGSSFVANPKNENEFLIDKYLSEKLPKWSETFMALLVNIYFNVYKKMEGGLVVPQAVLKFTAEYQKDNDMYIDFITSLLDKTGNKKDKISLQTVHEEFKTWYVLNYNCQKYPLKKEMRRYFEKKYGKACCTPNHLIGFVKKAKCDGDDDDEIVGNQFK